MAEWVKEDINLHQNWDEEYWADAEFVEDHVAQALKTDARNRYPEIIARISTSYSCKLQRYQDDLNAKRQQGQKAAHKVTVLDLDKFAVGLSYKLKNARIATALLQADGVDIAPYPEEWRPEISSGANSLTSPINYLQHFGGVAFRPMRTSKPEHPEWAAFDYIVPALDYAPSDFIGFSAEQYFAFANAHEAYHAIDPEFLTEKRPLSFGVIYTPDAESLLNDPVYRDDVERLVKGEGFGAIAPLGDMIRKGDDVTVIDPIIAITELDSFGHQVQDMLEGLKTEITLMGEDNFRAMNDDEALPFYIATAKKYGPTSRQLELAAKIHLADKAMPTNTRPELVAEITALDDHDPDVQKAQELALRLDPYRMAEMTQKYLEKRACGKEDISEKQRKIHKMDAAGELADRAFAHGGAVTPETMAHGFLAALETRRAQKEQGGDPDMLNAEMIKLQSVFIQDPVNYVAENRKRGLELAFCDNGLPIFVKAENAPLAHQSVIKTQNVTSGPLAKK